MPERQRLVSGFRTRLRNPALPGRRTGGRKREKKSGILLVTSFEPEITPCDLFGDQAVGVLCHNEIAAIIPPYDSTRNFGPYALLAKLEYAISVRKVPHIVVLGHAGCPGIETLVNGTDHAALASWVEVARLAMERARQIAGQAGPEALLRETERQVVVQSLRNLVTYPVVYKAVKDGAVSLNGWFYDGQRQALYEYDPDRHAFRPLGDGDGMDDGANGTGALPGSGGV